MSNFWIALSAITRVCMLIVGVYVIATSQSLSSTQLTNGLLILLLSGLNR